MKKKSFKYYLILISSFTLVGILVSLFSSEYLYRMITRQDIAASQFMPHSIIISIAKNKLHAMMFLSVAMLILMVLVLLLGMGNGNTFASELDEITDTIKTPKRVGQSQHGSARWLTVKEYDKVFTSYTIDKQNNPTIKKLYMQGMEEKKAVRDYKDTVSETEK